MKSPNELLSAFSKNLIVNHSREDIIFFALRHPMQIRLQNRVISQTCQQSVI